jgi:UDP-N-acetylmuramate dehydrogenase
VQPYAPVTEIDSPPPEASPELQEHVPLAPLTTLGVGGPARWLTSCRSSDELVAALAWAARRGVQRLVIGGGSNLLVSDDGFDGLVIRNAIAGIDAREEGSRISVRAGAGEEWDRFVEFCVANDLGGVECLSGIPGLVGATPIQNVGAYGQEVSETITEVEVLDTLSGEVRRLSNDECEFGYRASRFKNRQVNRFVVLFVTYSLERGGAPAIRYPDIERHLSSRAISAPGLAEVREAVIAIRRAKGMVVDPDDPDSRSAGSFFMNPIVDLESHDSFVARCSAEGIGGTPPSFPSKGGVKLSAAWLIENAGFSKGLRLGRAGLSTKHTLAIVNSGGATAREIVDLVLTIQRGVEEKFGIVLRPEPNLIGFDQATLRAICG